MAYNFPPRQARERYDATPTYGKNYSPPRNSPLRHGSNASTNSSAYSGYFDPFPPSRTSTVSSAASSGYHNYSGSVGQKRDLAKAGMANGHGHNKSGDSSDASAFKSARQSLRSLPQPPAERPNYDNPHPRRPDIQDDSSWQRRSRDNASHASPSKTAFDDWPVPSNPTSTVRDLPPHPTSTLRDLPPVPESGSRPTGVHSDHSHAGPRGGHFARPELSELQKSSTGYLRTLSRLAQDQDGSDFSMSTQGPSVAGLQNRRQLKRTDSTRGGGRQQVAQTTDNGLGFAGRNWMDKQRQFLQAYEYLCHIGEAKEWIEDVIQQPIPPIVQLEEALRDGVTLAEIVQAMEPSRPVRIFRNPKLQFRHIDNIAVFFRFLETVSLPELFRFETVDLYEKKNIPKVIHCLHALSWMLYKNGMVKFRIGNLVGQLQFEHHELEEVQKGLDRAGVSMPSFSGMGASFGAEPEPEPEPEPVETEEERIERELADSEAAIADLQAQIRGCITRLRLGDTMQELWDAEPLVTALQARVRGDWARQIAEYRVGMQRFATNLQSAARGFAVRNGTVKQEKMWRAIEPKVVALQSLVRARKAREEARFITTKVTRHVEGVRHFQAAVRGALRRKQLDDTYQEVQHAQAGIEKIQAAAVAMLQRQKFQRQKAELRQTAKAVTALQSRARAVAERAAIASQRNSLQSQTPLYRALQAVARGVVARRHQEEVREELGSHQEQVRKLQAQARGRKARQDVTALRESLEETSASTALLQSASRGLLLRRRNASDKAALRSHQAQLTPLQSNVRAMLFRRSHFQLLEDLQATTPQLVHLQALSRAMILRVQVGETLAELDDAETSIELLQTAIRGLLVRASFAEKKRYFQQNMQKVVKLQSFVRAKQQGQAYKSLTSGKNPPVGTVKNFVHLLNDSDFDFDEEVESERLRKTVVQHVRQNELADQYIAQLDVKIALLVKNKITLDEIVKTQKGFGNMTTLLRSNVSDTTRDSFDLKALNKDSRKRLELYQEMFFLLQTQPQYLSRLFRQIRERATPEKECERTKHLTMGLFGFAQKHREEYYLVRLLARSVREEVDTCANLQEYLRGNFFWARVFGAYTKTPRDRKYMRDLLAPVIRENILDNRELDLESDPLNIYHASLNDEQLRTGQRSTRRPDVSREEAIRDPETKRAFIRHLQDLRDIADQIFAQLEETIPKLPYGVRYVAQQTLHHLSQRFPYEEQGNLLQLIGHWVWKSYLQPALAEPEKFGVLDRALTPEQRKNLAEVAKVVTQCCSGRLFGQDNVFLQPLNSYVSESIGRLRDIWAQLLDVPDAETQFEIDEFNDLYAKTKPTLYIKMADIFAVHRLIAADVTCICPDHDDVLRTVIRELGSAQRNETEMAGVGSSEICLTLNPKLHNVEDPDAEIKTLFMETKRCVLYIIRIQSGPDLLSILVQPITTADEDRWQALVRSELRASSTRPKQRSAYSDNPNPLTDIASLSYSELKRTALEHVVALESSGRLSRHNRYQDLLNAIAIDIRTKHRRRVLRARELAATRLTLGRLDEQAKYLDTRLRAYNDYVEQAMATLQRGHDTKGRRKRFVMPFTKQWDHERELARSGRVPRFGSWKYAAQELQTRNVLVNWQGRGPATWNRLDITLSSNEVGVFNVEGSMGSVGIPGATAEITLDELLQAQWNGTPFLEMFDEGEKVRFEVGAFVGLVMRKFYKDRDG